MSNVVPRILYEDETVTVVDKPAGLVVNRSESALYGTLQDWLKERGGFPAASSDELRSGIVHRLDKDTSGVLLVAKTETAWRALQEQFRRRLVKKEYVALVHGHLSPREGEVRVPLKRSRIDRRVFAIDLAGKESETRYLVECFYRRVVQRFDSPSYQGFSLVRLFPTTGRTHQLRVVLKHLRHPIVGDLRYLGKRRARADAVWVPRQFLHAQSLTFMQPFRKTPVTVAASLPTDLEKVMSLLEEME